MPELRKDPIAGRWVIIATERARRPGNFVGPERNFFLEQAKAATCPFCNNQEEAVYTQKNERSDYPHSPWDVKIVHSGTPVASTGEKFKRRGKGLYDIINSYGAHEVVIETPEHVANMADLSVGQVRLILETYTHRFQELEKNDSLQYALVYKNYGWAAGSRRIGHSRSMILSTAVNPARVKEKLAGAKRYYDYHERCVFCDILRQELDAKKRVVVQTDMFAAITPFAPRFPFEVWIVPKTHHCDYAEGVAGHEHDLAVILKDILLRFKIGLGDPAYNFALHTAPFRKGQRAEQWSTIEEDYHWHLELIPRLTRPAGFEKGSGFYICAIPPEASADYLREVHVA